MLLIGLFTPVVVIGGREVMEAAAEGTRGGERCPDGGEDTDELSGLRESNQKEKNHVTVLILLELTTTNRFEGKNKIKNGINKGSNANAQKNSRTYPKNNNDTDNCLVLYLYH